MKGFSSILLGILFVTAVWVFVWPAANAAYFAAVLAHLAAGVALLVVLMFALRTQLRDATQVTRIGWILLGTGGILGAVLIYTGTRRAEWPLLYAHIGACLAGGALLASEWAGRRGFFASDGSTGAIWRGTAFVVAAAVIAASAWWVRTVPWQHAHRIENPAIAPESMDAEGDGPSGQFFPSSGQTYTGKTVPEDYFMDSSVCQRCHADIYKQWEGSAHHFSSFNNQWYRKSIEYMQEVDGVQASKWCAGCHDAALFFPGNFETPIKDRTSTPAAQAGMGCMVCHSIQKVKSTMGQGDYVLEYPAMHRLVASTNPLVRRAIDFLIEENPEPHRRTFLKPFMRSQTAEYCSVCHKVHLDVPVNNYRWIRGFNDYDNWQASGVSGEGARSFYYPTKPQDCADCHMTLVASHDAGNVGGMVHSHRFLAANTALPFANRDGDQLAQTENFLADGKLRVDIFAMSPEKDISTAGAEKAGPSSLGIQTTFAVGEEAEAFTAAGPGAEIPLPAITAPLNRVPASVGAGDTVRVDVVVRTLKMGHFFPGGTVDAFDCWLELKATDDDGRPFFWSGLVQDNGHGAVEPGAHFYRSLSIDAHGNPTNKRNAWATRATVYAHLIPPGAADTAHFRMEVPKDAKGRIHLVAKLNYRKFAWWNTQFSYAGVSESAVASDVAKSYDDRRVSFSGDVSKASGQIKAIPDLPVVTVAQDAVDVEVLPADGATPAAKTAFDTKEWQRWNDYGIGLLLQGYLKGAKAAFEKITEGDATNPDGWVNLGRVNVQEGNLAAAKQALERALSLNPQLARAHFFYARALRSEGRYDEALQHLREVLAQYPRDRVVHNDAGRILFLERRYDDAVREFQSTLEIDPEDLEANYNLMLCYTGIGRPERAAEFKKRYLRFKADESAQTLTGPYDRSHPDDNRERQLIHEHVSALPAPEVPAKPAKKKYAMARTHVDGGN